jgi:predicted DNA-binding transcriptional regulator AlpA
MVANEPLVTIREVRKLTARTDPTIARWVKCGILPKPIYVNGLRAWRASDISATLERLRAQPRRSFPPGREDDGRDLGHALREEFDELKAAAGDALALAGADATGKVLARFTSSGRLADIAPKDRRAAIRGLRRLVDADRGTERP